MMSLLIQTQPSQSLIEQQSTDPLVNRSMETDVYILTAILLVAVLLVIGLINRKIENMMIFALFLSAILIVLILALFR